MVINHKYFLVLATVLLAFLPLRAFSSDPEAPRLQKATASLVESSDVSPKKGVKKRSSEESPQEVQEAKRPYHSNQDKQPSLASSQSSADHNVERSRATVQTVGLSFTMEGMVKNFISLETGASSSASSLSFEDWFDVQAQLSSYHADRRSPLQLQEATSHETLRVRKEYTQREKNALAQLDYAHFLLPDDPRKVFLYKAVMEDNELSPGTQALGIFNYAYFLSATDPQKIVLYEKVMKADVSPSLRALAQLNLASLVPSLVTKAALNKSVADDSQVPPHLRAIARLHFANTVSVSANDKMDLYISVIEDSKALPETRVIGRINYACLLPSTDPQKAMLLKRVLHDKDASEGVRVHAIAGFSSLIVEGRIEGKQPYEGLIVLVKILEGTLISPYLKESINNYLHSLKPN